MKNDYNVSNTLRYINDIRNLWFIFYLIFLTELFMSCMHSRKFLNRCVLKNWLFEKSTISLDAYNLYYFSTALQEKAEDSHLWDFTASKYFTPIPIRWIEKLKYKQYVLNVRTDFLVTTIELLRLLQICYPQNMC